MEKKCDSYIHDNVMCWNNLFLWVLRLKGWYIDHRFEIDLSDLAHFFLFWSGFMHLKSTVALLLMGATTSSSYS